ncbi:MAG: glutathione S-transferase family protein [Pseudomonadota bacterium]
MLTLVIADKNYSSWSMRPWLMLTAAGIAFEEVMLPFNSDGWKDKVLGYSAAGCVPVLIDGAVTVWESVAILEYLHDQHPEAGVWPNDPAARAYARSVAVEMAAGFRALRSYYPMNIRRHVPDRPPTEAVAADIARITAIWREMRQQFGAGGPYLCGAAFSGADAMYAPVVARFLGYDVEVGPVERAYIEAVVAHPAYAAWQAAALQETDIVEADEV